MVTFTIDGKTVEAAAGTSILDAALEAGIYIPHLCSHQSVEAFGKVVLNETVYQGQKAFAGEFAGKTVRESDGKGCGLCRVMIEGQSDPVGACRFHVEEGLSVRTTGEDLVRIRQMKLNKILADHPHACLLCEQREGCSRTQCSMNVPEADRCCVLLGSCEIGKVSDFVGYATDLPPYKSPPEKIILTDPLFIRDYSLCIGCLKCVRVCRDVVKADVLGTVVQGDKFVVGTKKPGDMPEAECRFCGACIEVCPTGALRDVENVETPAKGAPLPCTHACPAGIDIPHYVRKIADGDLESARKVIAESVPLPATLGFVCFHPCEDHCRRGHLDEPVAICDLKRFAFDTEEAYPKYVKGEATGKNVAIIGAGPAGLTSAWLLAMKGHQVTLFDAAKEPGGFLRQTLPNFRLSRQALDRDLKFIDDLEIEFQGGRRVGDDLDPRSLREFGYDAVLMAMGTPISKRIDVLGAELKGVLWGVDYLRAAASNSPIQLDGHVIVVGGGGVATDTAMTALRSGADSVEIVSLEQRHELPAMPAEIEDAEEEGIEFTCGWGPQKFSGERGKVQRAEFLRCNRVYDAQGRFAPEYAISATIERECSWVILAVGQNSDGSVFGPEAGTVLKNRGFLPPESESVETWLPGFFGAGDLVHGPSSVVEAIASGKRAAASIDEFLGGDGEFGTHTFDDQPFDGLGIELKGRQDVQKRSSDTRVKDFDLIRASMDPVQASAEANRCLRCNIRHQVVPAILPPEEWTPLQPSLLETAPDEGGVCTLADHTGKVLKIKGAISIRELLEEWVYGEKDTANRKVRWVVDQMYTQRESELIQTHIREHGEMPDGDDELDDLF